VKRESVHLVYLGAHARVGTPQLGLVDDRGQLLTTRNSVLEAARGETANGLTSPTPVG
jgi:hypothetical protein